MNVFKKILKELEDAAPGPYKAKIIEVNGRKMVSGIYTWDGNPVVDEDYGLLYGAGGDIDSQLSANAALLTHAPVHIEILARALKRACGYNQSTIEFLCNHAYKEILQEKGLLEKDISVKVIST